MPSDILRLASRALDGLWTNSLPPQEAHRIESLLLSSMPSEASWTAASPYVENALAALCYALRVSVTGNPQDAGFAARQVYEALDYFVHNRENIDFNQPGAESRILRDPEVQAQLRRLISILDELALTDSSPDSIAEQLRRQTADTGTALASRICHGNEI